MNILIVGRGSIANKHKLNIESFGHKVCLLSDIIQTNTLDEISIINHYHSVLDRFNAVVIANATNKHFDYAYEALKKNKKIYLEKPPCISSQELKQLQELEKKYKNYIALGFQMRFSKGLNMLKIIVEENTSKVISFDVHVGQTLRNWREGGINKDRYYSDRRTGGGVLHELSHEIDIALWMFGRPKKCTHIATNLLHKDMNIDDYFHSIWEYDGMCGVVHLDMIDPTYERYVEVNFNNYKLTWNIENDSLLKESDYGLEVIYENKSFKKQDLIYLSIQNFLSWLKEKDKWYGANLQQSEALVNFIEDICNET